MTEDDKKFLEKWDKIARETAILAEKEYPSFEERLDNLMEQEPEDFFDFASSLKDRVRNKQDEEMLYADLCGRIPYDVLCQVELDDGTFTTRRLIGCNTAKKTLEFDGGLIIDDVFRVKPYLRQFENLRGYSMTLMQSFTSTSPCDRTDYISWADLQYINDYINANHIDYHFLHKKALALPAPDGLYNTWCDQIDRERQEAYSSRSKARHE